ncbi:polysaccharide export outer membrane protein [Arcticibacter pallidicorallinus]|uniref:Polysaccharide export outer membrane protein n=1 Tax=Arcticibacter pallidicorallinus TaxID=1259464 RepID=A0A2T0UBL8_9SPHI|nr:polysaccharide biosynthesis/export family protein [Arcticibacter pallidicorallinus]PRY55284.1 polysaccharide export outer membrane protein [Arcticibacter pallidicorallinus]
MLKSRAYDKLCLIIALFGVLILSSCVVTKKSVYFTDIPDTAAYRKIIPAEFKEPVIQPDDLLSITVQTIDPATSASVNQVSAMPAIGASSASTVGSQTISGFLVDKNGTVTMPMLGSMKLAGLTTYQARDLIQTKASEFFKEPNVQVRFANYKITIIGEVSRPATYTLPNEKVTLLDAIGLAGDLTIYGRRENVLLIRDNNGTKEFTRFNLNSTDIFKSPYFFLRQNDVIYVEPGKAKVAANNAARTQTLAIVGSILSVLIVALSRL